MDSGNLTDNIDIIAPFHVLRGDNWHAIDLYVQSQPKATLWSVRPPHPEYASRYPIHTIRPFQGNTPAASKLLICGTETEIGSWYEHGTARHVILMLDTLESLRVYQTLNRLGKPGKHLSIQYATQALKDMIGLPGEVVTPLFNATRFLANTTIPNEQEHAKFKIGRASRDVRIKHHWRDPIFYRRLLDEDMQLEVVGGTCLLPLMQPADNLHLLPVKPQQALANFMRGLDCFFYRTSPSSRGGVDRILFEAMACGLPIVAEKRDENTALISNGENGFLFMDEQQALDYIMQLRKDRSLREQISNEAMRTMQKIAVQ